MTQFDGSYLPADGPTREELIAEVERLRKMVERAKNVLDHIAFLNAAGIAIPTQMIMDATAAIDAAGRE